MTSDMTERGLLKKVSVLETCGTCHAQRKAQAVRYSHMPIGEGKMECTSCHNPHGSANEKLLVASSVNETCFNCHTDNRGPFLWEHAPVVENCANCHDAHGSNKEKMLKVARPRLCQQCHAGGTGHPITAAARRAPERRAVRVQPRLLQLPLQHSRLQPSGRPILHEVARTAARD